MYMYANYMFGQQLMTYLRASINPLLIDMPSYLRRGKQLRTNAIAMVNEGVARATKNSTLVARVPHNFWLYCRRGNCGGDDILEFLGERSASHPRRDN